MIGSRNASPCSLHLQRAPAFCLPGCRPGYVPGRLYRDTRHVCGRPWPTLREDRGQLEHRSKSGDDVKLLQLGANETKLLFGDEWLPRAAFATCRPQIPPLHYSCPPFVPSLSPVPP